MWDIAKASPHLLLKHKVGTFGPYHFRVSSYRLLRMIGKNAYGMISGAAYREGLSASWNLNRSKMRLDRMALFPPYRPSRGNFAGDYVAPTCDSRTNFGKARQRVWLSSSLYLRNRSTVQALRADTTTPQDLQASNLPNF